MENCFDLHAGICPSIKLATKHAVLLWDNADTRTRLITCMCMQANQAEIINCDYEDYKINTL